MNCILVGGCGDGRRVVLPEGQMHFELVPLIPIDIRFNDVLGPIDYEVHHYNLFRLHPVTRAVIFAYDQLTPTQIMERLLECYTPKKEER